MNRIVLALSLAAAFLWLWVIFDDEPASPGIAAKTLPHQVRSPVSASKAIQSRQAEVLDVDPGVLRVVLGLAAMEGFCAQGKKKACAVIQKNDNAGLKQLFATRERLNKACGRHAFKACFLRGELDFKSGRPASAATWYGRGKVLAMAAASRCSGVASRAKAGGGSCGEIQDVLAQIGGREREISSLRERGH